MTFRIIDDISIKYHHKYYGLGMPSLTNSTFFLLFFRGKGRGGGGGGGDGGVTGFRIPALIFFLCLFDSSLAELMAVNFDYIQWE